MLTKKFTFLSSDNMTTIHAVRWLPDCGKYDKILQITHGMVEHIGRYEKFAAFLTERNYMVVGMDFLGHGDSVLNKERWGYFAEKTPSNILCRDMQKLRRYVQKKNPGVPYFMLGHSMGSYMLRKYLAFFGEGLDGAVIMGTGYVSPSMTRFGMAVTGAMAGIHGWQYRSRLVDKLTKGRVYQRYDLTGKNYANSWLTKDEEIVKIYHEDPRCRFLFTLNGYLGLFEAVLFSCRKKNIEKVPATLPLLFVSGEDDPVGDMGKGVRKVYRLYQATGHKDVSCKLYADDRHEILNELDKEQVFEDIYAWMESRRKD